MTLLILSLILELQLAVSSGATSEDELCSKAFPRDSGSAVFWYLDLIMHHFSQEVEALN